MQFVQKYFWLIMLVSLTLGFVLPSVGMILKDYVTEILIVIMTLSCLKIDIASLVSVRHDWWRFLVLLFLMYIVPTILVFFSKYFLDEKIFLGLLIAAAMPCAVSVVFISDLLGGEPPKALVATSIAHIISPFVTPFLVYLFAHANIDVNFYDMMILILKLVAVPFVFAQLLRYLHVGKILSRVSSTVNAYLLVALIWGITAAARIIFLNNLSQVGVIAIFVSFILIGVITISILFGRNKKEDITWSIVGMYKNLGLSSVIALNMFGPIAVLGSVVYTIVGNLAIAALQFWGRKRPL